MKSEFLPYRFPSRVSGAVAIEHVSVIPMDSNRVLADQTVVVSGGRITRLGPASSTPAPEGATIVDGRGKYLMPGFCDMYTHYRDPAESPLYLAHGITTARTSGNAFQVGLQAAANNGEFPTPWMIVVTQGIDGLNDQGRTDMPTNTPLQRPEDAAALAASLIRQGYRQLMPFSLLTPDSLAALGRAAKDLGVRMVGNCPNALSWEEAVERGMSGFQQTHLIARGHMLDEFSNQTYWDRFDPAPGTKLDFDKIRRLGGFLAKHQAWNLPTIVFHQRASQPAEVSLAHPSLRYVPQSSVNDWETTIIRWGRRGHVGPEEWRALARKRVENFHRCVGIFHEEGVPQVTCTDGLNPYNVQGDTLLQEIENFAAAGMGAYAALRCATSEAARYMGEESEWGTVATGKRADLVLLRQNPLEDIKAVRSVDTVFVNGYHLDRATLDDLLQQREALAKGAPPVASTRLPPATEGTVAEEGTWREMICGAPFGRVSFRHSKLADGGWLVEERHAGANPRRHPERKTVSLRLDAKLNVLRGSVTVESYVGAATGTVLYDAASGYTLNHTAMNGSTSTRTLAGPPRPPSEQTALSIVPRLAAAYGPATIPALDLEGAEPGGAELALTAGETAGEWKLDVSRLGARGSQTYSLAADGSLAGMSETTILLWPRELVPEGGGTA